MFQSAYKVNDNKNNDLIIWHKERMNYTTSMYLSTTILILVVPTITKEEGVLIQCLEKAIRGCVIMLLMFSIVKDQNFTLQDIQYQVVYDQSSVETPC